MRSHDRGNVPDIRRRMRLGFAGGFSGAGVVGGRQEVSLIDALVDAQAKSAGWPKPEREYRFHPERKWRFDYAFPERMTVSGATSGGETTFSPRFVRPVAVEVQGGIWNRGKHGRGSGILKDYEKLNTAQAMGWRVLQLTPAQVRAGELETWLRKIAA